MGEAPSGKTVDFLKPFAEDPNMNVRASLMSALGKTGSMRAIPMLTKGLKDDQPLVRAKAVEALGFIRSSAVIPILQDVLSKPENVIVELYAAAGLARLGEKIDLATADNALSQLKDHDTRILAIEVFEARGGQQAFERLRYALADADSAVRVRAASALVKLLQTEDDGSNNR
jgi:HEAT repeat protein